MIYNENRSSIGIQWLLGIAFRWRGRGQGVAGAWSLQKEFKYSNVDHLSTLIREHKPSFLVNAAGFTGKPNVDACESAKYESLEGNAVLPGIIREVCEDLKIPWGHISSGCIYSGRRDGWEGVDRRR